MIKYRVYDTEQKRYLNTNNVSISGGGVLRVTNYEDGYYASISQLPNENSPRFIIEQYTGLKDKNGVEIFAGDILHCTIRSIDESVTQTIVAKEGLRCSDLSYCEQFEVIGNIHEGSELRDISS